MSTPATIRLMLVDDHAILRAGLVNLLNGEPGLQVVAVADDGESALKLWREHRPDIMLLDISLGGMDGIETVRRLRADFPEARVELASLQRPLAFRKRRVAAKARGRGRRYPDR